MLKFRLKSFYQNYIKSLFSFFRFQFWILVSKFNPACALFKIKEILKTKLLFIKSGAFLSNYLTIIIWSKELNKGDVEFDAKNRNSSSIVFVYEV